MNKPHSITSDAAKHPSLSFVAALWTAAAIAVVMAVYAVLQKALEPDVTWRELFVHHLWHVFVLGGVIHLACWLVFRRLLDRPLNRIYVHLYAMGQGQLGPLQLHSRIRELVTIVDGINLLVWRMGRVLDPKALPDAQENIRVIREALSERSAQQPNAFSEVTERLDRVEKDLLALAQAGARKTAPVSQ